MKGPCSNGMGRGAFAARVAGRNYAGALAAALPRPRRGTGRMTYMREALVAAAAGACAAALAGWGAAWALPPFLADTL